MRCVPSTMHRFDYKFLSYDLRLIFFMKFIVFEDGEARKFLFEKFKSILDHNGNFYYYFCQYFNSFDNFSILIFDILFHFWSHVARCFHRWYFNFRDFSFGQFNFRDISVFHIFISNISAFFQSISLCSDFR